MNILDRMTKTCDLWVNLVNIVPSERHGNVIGALRKAGLDPADK